MAESEAPRRELLEVCGVLVKAMLLSLFIILFVAQSHVVEGSSMEPTLQNRERLMVDKVTYRFRAPRRGEIVVFRYPAQPRLRFVKRVIGVPGDRVEVRDNRVYVNGMALDEPYTSEPTYGHFPAVTVQDGHMFVLGDNRNHSDDSRFSDVGQVPFSLVVGRAVFAYWPPALARLFRIPQTIPFG